MSDRTRLPDYPKPLSASELRDLGCSQPTIQSQHQGHILGLVLFLRDIQERTGRTFDSLLASEQRAYDRLVSEARAVEALRKPTMHPYEALRRLEAGE